MNVDAAWQAQRRSEAASSDSDRHRLVDGRSESPCEKDHQAAGPQNDRYNPYINPSESPAGRLQRGDKSLTFLRV